MNFFQVLHAGLIDELHRVPAVNVHAWEQMLCQWRLDHGRPRDFVACLTCCFSNTRVAEVLVTDLIF